MSTQDVNAMLVYYREAIRMLQKNFNYPEERAMKLVDKVLRSYINKDQKDIQNPRRVLMSAVRQRAIKGKPEGWSP